MKIVLAILALIVFCTPAIAGDLCADCHSEKTPLLVSAWQESAHGKNSVSCTDCHGSDISLNHDRKTTVTAEKCGMCHKRAYETHNESRHGIGMITGRACTRNLNQTDDIKKGCTSCHAEGSQKPVSLTQCAMYLAQSGEMQKHGCETCHRVQTGCDSCHTKHSTGLSYAGSPETCGICHMGPDHAQYEMWRASKHGAVYLAMGQGKGPDCKACHMGTGSHNVSTGIASGRVDFAQQRKTMVGNCSKCHASGFAEESLREADNIEIQSRGILNAAQAVLEDLYDKELIEPAPADRPAHPLGEGGLVLGPHMLYEDISKPESMYFRMMMFYYTSSYKGAFHQSPDYTHWYGNAPLKMTLSELKSEALLLKKISSAKEMLDALKLKLEGKKDIVSDVKGRLKELKSGLIEGNITKEEFEKQKKKIMDDLGL